MLKKDNRLSSVRLYSYKSVTTPLFSVKFSKNNLSLNRFGFVISKKIDKRAVIRNSLKRKFSSCIEEIFDRIESGNDFVFYPTLVSVEIDRQKLLDEIKNTLPLNK